jgi:hypothetical protein
VESASLAERIQERFPDLQVVKALNMVAPDVMTHPDRLPEETTVFVAGEDPEAKATVADLLRSFGWRSILDLGGVARPGAWSSTVHCGTRWRLLKGPRRSTCGSCEPDDAVRRDRGRRWPQWTDRRRLPGQGRPQGSGTGAA